MGLIYNLVMSVIHLTFVAIDILMLMILLNFIYARWKHPVFKQITELLEPFLMKALNVFRCLISRFCSRHFNDTALLILLLISLWILRILIIGFIS